MASSLVTRSPTAQAWADAATRVYADLVESSDFVERVVPLLGPLRHDLLDIGAGNGQLGARMIASGGRWQAVESNWVLRRRLRLLRPTLDQANVELQILGSPWQHLLPETRADDVIVSSPVVARSDPVTLFDSMRKRWRRTMTWVMLVDHRPEELPEALSPTVPCAATTGPLLDRVLDALGGAREPQRIHLVQWTIQPQPEELAAAPDTASIRHLIAGASARPAPAVARKDHPHLSEPAPAEIRPTRERRRSALLVWEA